MSHAPPRFGWIAPALCLGVAAWTAGGVLDVAGSGRETVRVAMLPALWVLVASVTVALGAAWMLTRSGFPGDAMRPLIVLGLAIVPFLPFVADWLPALRVAAGPAGVALWIVTAWLVLLALPRRSRSPLPMTQGIVFVLGVAVFGTAAARLTGSTLFPGGDEPHYLVVTQSLLHDGDLKIEDNHRREEYRAYFNRELGPHYLTRGVDNEIYSVHPVGLPVIAVPAFALAGYQGVVAMLVLMAALAASLVWAHARAISGSTEAATFAWAAVALTPPFLFNSFTVYPEVPAALAVAVAFSWRAESTAVGVALARGVAIAALPWLSTKYLPMAMVLGSLAAARSIRNARALALLIVPIALSLAGWFAFFYAFWGTMSPSAPYGTQENMALGYLARGLPGLLFDQEYGAVALAPVLVVALAGVVWMARTTQARRLAVETAAVGGALLVTVGAFHVWWGGTAAPGRPIVSALLLAGVPLAWLYERVRRAAHPAWRVLCHALLAVSVAQSFLLGTVREGALINNGRDGSSALLEWMSDTWWLPSAWPSFVAGSVSGAWAYTVLWIGVIAAVGLLVRRLAGASVGSTALGLVGGGLAVGAVVASVLPPSVRSDPDARARVRFFDDFDARARPTGVVYAPLRLEAPRQILARMTLRARPTRSTQPDLPDLLGNARYGLPAGEYRLVVDRVGEPSSIALQIGRAGEPRESWATASHLDQRFTLPVDAVYVGFRAPANFGPSTLAITPIDIVDRGQRAEGPEVIRVATYGAHVVYFHDDRLGADPTGFWTLGGTTSHVTFTSPTSAPDRLTLTVHCGARRNDLDVTTTRGRERLTFEPGQTRTVDLPAERPEGLDLRISPVTFRVAEGFVPAELEPGSTDRRRLGCWIGLR